MLFYLAAMHFNENAESPQQKTAKEKLCTDLPNNFCCPQPHSVNYPQEDDETLSKDGAMDGALGSPRPKQCSPSSDFNSSLFKFPDGSRQPTRTQCTVSNLSISSETSSYVPYQRPLGLPAGYSQPTPFPSRTEESQSTLNPHKGVWHHPMPVCDSSLDGYSAGPLPSFMISGSCSHYQSEMSFSRPHCGSLPLSGRCSPDQSGLEQPCSLHSLPMPAALQNFHLYPHPQWRMACCAQCPMEVLRIDPVPHQAPGNPRPYLPSCPNPIGPLHRNSIHRDHSPVNPGPKSDTAQLSFEQRKVFVTYETDNDEHVKEVINFVALLRHNGFYTHIDMFEQQFRSINKIDFMERYISEKDYLIIFVISPKYYETVTSTTAYTEDDETLNTVYIHKQLQNEFIQNGCKNFRFIPILFPGAKKWHVPRWLQNTHIYSWPRDHDDILRRLMRVEKYNPPPIGPLPTIVSVPI
ncbi:E3 ubiquitin ligase TRAF3IP2 isoform X1 [Alosa alosa]|uniref:E3 ubiquitin ligase TRAF3IP2 isoform X1 n=1 Tax=Alosa alosa TaxID=278164 RepID=UPI002015135E|nr:E3 ubiquitin ligase TRAF3IP2 isoform X1 [Alosa alosa]